MCIYMLYIVSLAVILRNCVCDNWVYQFPKRRHRGQMKRPEERGLERRKTSVEDLEGKCVAEKVATYLMEAWPETMFVSRTSTSLRVQRSSAIEKDNRDYYQISKP